MNAQPASKEQIESIIARVSNPVLSFTRTHARVLVAEIERLRRDSEDAAKWRALRNCSRITAMGSAGIDAQGSAHVTLNFWTHNERETETYPREWLDAFVEKALRAAAVTKLRASP